MPATGFGAERKRKNGAFAGKPGSSVFLETRIKVKGLRRVEGKPNEVRVEWIQQIMELAQSDDARHAQHGGTKLGEPGVAKFAGGVSRRHRAPIVRHFNGTLNKRGR